jgi:hypothetical protein
MLGRWGGESIIKGMGGGREGGAHSNFIICYLWGGEQLHLDPSTQICFIILITRGGGLERGWVGWDGG